MRMVTVEEHRQRQAGHLKALRERLGLKRIEMAVKLGFEDSQGYALYERARSIIRLDQIPRWAEAFDVPLREFLEEVVIKAAEDAAQEVNAPDEQRYPVLKNLLAVGVDPEYARKLDGDLAEKDEVTRRSVTEDAIADHRDAEESRRRSG